MERLRQRFLGAILGCAVGDALGAPFEGAPSAAISFPPDDIRFQKISGYPVGQYTDDTQLTLATMRAICRAGCVDGYEIAAEFIELWRTGEIIGAGASCSDAVYDMIHGGTHWKHAGTPPGRAGNGTAMRAAPIGLWNYAHPEHIAEDAETASIITHKDARSIAGTIAVAKAVELCVNSDDIVPADFLQSLANVTRATSELFAQGISDLAFWLDFEPQRALPLIYAAGKPDIGPRKPGWVTPYVVPTVLCSLYFFLNTPRSFIASVTSAIGAGGDTDTVGAITGAISGAFNGVDSIPRRLIETLKDSRELLELTEQFYEMATG